MNFSTRVERLREKRALSVAEVLELVGVSPAMMSMIRSGKRNPSVKTLRRLETAELESGLIESTRGPNSSHGPKILREGRPRYGPDVKKEIMEIKKVAGDLLSRIEKLERKVNDDGTD